MWESVDETSLCFGTAHGAYVASVPNLFFPFPFFPLSGPSTRAEHEAADAADADAADATDANANGTDMGNDGDEMKKNKQATAGGRFPGG